MFIRRAKRELRPRRLALFGSGNQLREGQLQCRRHVEQRQYPAFDFGVLEALDSVYVDSDRFGKLQLGQIPGEAALLNLRTKLPEDGS